MGIGSKMKFLHCLQDISPKISLQYFSKSKDIQVLISKDYQIIILLFLWPI